MAVAAVIFDLDGTLIDSASFSVSILNSMLQARGSTKVITVASVQRSLSLGGEALMQDALGASAETSGEQLKAFRAEYERRPFPPQRVYPGVVEMLKALSSRGVRLAICTKKPAHLTHKVLSDLGWVSMFEVVSGGDSEPFSKPDARHLHAVVSRLGLAAEQVLFVGDSHVDALLAKNAAVRFVFADYGYDEGLVVPGECFAVVHEAAGVCELVMGGSSPSPRKA